MGEREKEGQELHEFVILPVLKPTLYRDAIVQLVDGAVVVEVKETCWSANDTRNGEKEKGKKDEEEEEKKKEKKKEEVPGRRTPAGSCQR